MAITKVRRSLLVSMVMVFFFNVHHLQVMSSPHKEEKSCTNKDRKLLEFPLNLEYLEAEFFLFGALGFGLDKVAPNLTMGGPSPLGAQKANLDPLTRDVILQFAWQEVGHLRAIKKRVKGFARPQLDLSKESFANVMDKAFGKKFVPPFNPYANSYNYLIASYLVPYVGLTGYVGANPKLKCPSSRKLVAGLLGVESGQDAVIRAMLNARASKIVHPYNITVAAFTNKISELRNKLGKTGLKDEGLMVRKADGAEGKVIGNVLAGDESSLSYDRTPEEILRIVYGSGNESIPGGFYPKGANGDIAKLYY
ncbi:PREDICTED: desiccation-related protein PCC13-62-like [Camelina sativa]|uniref:Desiccation-related protein PCC13-62-like n=1 Tax=Camelina sativa TaxID=90675 RepID=A0ABM0X1F9_CAMSA|nr:PREDICTED: desiccation-related protein PCC13-62-like [Camelina sativa]